MFKRTELYRFVEGSLIDTQSRGNKPVVYDAGSGNETYTPYAIGRGQVESKTELARASLQVTLALNNPVAQRYLSGIADSVLTLTIFQQTDSTVNVSWKGRLAKVKLSNKNVTMVFESIFTSLRRPGLRARYQKSCRHTLYGPGCNLDKALFEHEDDIASIASDGLSYTIGDLSLFEEGYFSGGMIEASNGVFRYIAEHSGNVVTLSRRFEFLESEFATLGAGNVPVSLYPGCPKSIEVCHERFDNVLNYGGFPWIPTRNPFSGSIV